MSVNGIKINGVVEKYDYGSLVNINVQTGHLADNAVTTAKLNDGAVTADKLNDGAATTDKLGADVIEIFNNKANIDGSYDDMAVGIAGQLQSNIGIEDEIPYAFRTSGGSIDIGDKERIDAIIGGTVVWNQLAPLTAAQWSKSKVDVTFDGTKTVITSNSSQTNVLKYAYLPLQLNHKYLFLGVATAVTASIFFGIFSGITGNVYEWRVTTTPGNSITIDTIKSNPYENGYVRIQMPTATVSDEYCEVSGLQVIDLTKMFGAVIADYVYSLEQANAGAGAAWFKRLFPASYYAYNSGEIMSVKTSAHKMTGFNQWDEQWELGGLNATTGQPFSGTDRTRSKNFCRCLPDTVYYCRTASEPNLGIFWYDSNQNYINRNANKSNATVRSPKNASYFKISMANVAIYQNDTCVNIHWDGERDGEYEAYQEWNYPLDSDLELRGLPKLDANNKLYYDGDTYASNGTVTRKYEYRAYASGDGSLADAITDGTHTVVKLGTPTTEQADPYHPTQNVSDWGTEEYADSRTVPIPVGHDTLYQQNLKAKLEMSPDSPSDGDGLYVVRQISGKNVYVPLIVPNEIPDAPTTDGTYVLKATVSNGTATYSWVSE